MTANIFDDLVAEQDRLEAILDDARRAGLAQPVGAPPDGRWPTSCCTSPRPKRPSSPARPRPPPAATRRGGAASRPTTSPSGWWRRSGPRRRRCSTVGERLAGSAVAALRAADPEQRLSWAAAPLKPRTLATTRLAEHWAHGLDITGPLGIDFPDTDRLRHICWLGHATLPYGFMVAGEEPHEVFCELTAPSGTTWVFGRPEADSTISGPAGAFCRVGAHRVSPDESGLATTGPHGAAALRVLRNYAA